MLLVSPFTFVYNFTTCMHTCSCFNLHHLLLLKQVECQHHLVGTAQELRRHCHYRHHRLSEIYFFSYLFYSIFWMIEARCPEALYLFYSSFASYLSFSSSYHHCQLILTQPWLKQYSQHLDHLDPNILEQVVGNVLVAHDEMNFGEHRLLVAVQQGLKRPFVPFAVRLDELGIGERCTHDSTLSNAQPCFGTFP